MAVVKFLFVVAVVVLPGLLSGEQCKPDILRPCIAHCNGTCFDLSSIFTFPMNVSGFIWSPCDGFNCTGTTGQPTMDCAVCQNIVASYNVSCGKMSEPVWMWDMGKEGTPENWQIEYTFGDTWRISIFEFVVDETQEDPIVKFVGEDPVLQYNFRIIGKCIGQNTFECRKYYNKRNNNNNNIT